MNSIIAIDYNFQSSINWGIKGADDETAGLIILWAHFYLIRSNCWKAAAYTEVSDGGCVEI